MEAYIFYAQTYVSKEDILVRIFVHSPLWFVFCLFFFRLAEKPYRRLCMCIEKRQYGVPFASISIFFLFVLFCTFDYYCAISHTNTHTRTSAQTINAHFREGWLSILGNALYNICRKNGPMRNSRLLSHVCVIQYKLHAFASSSSSSPHIVSSFVHGWTYGTLYPKDPRSRKT